MQWYNDFINTSSLTGETLAHRKFLELFADPDDKTKTWTADQETISVPATGLWTLQHVIAGDPTNTTICKFSSGTGGSGTVYEVVFGPPGASQVQAIPFSGRLRFGSSLVSGTVYANYKTCKSDISVVDFARLWAKVVDFQTSIVAVQYQLPTFSCNAGENMTDRFVYISSADNKAYIADPSDYNKLPVGYVRGTVLANAAVNVEVVGVSEELNYANTPYPYNHEIYIGRTGVPSYSNDISLVQLQSGDYKKVVGYSLDGYHIYFNCLNPVSRIS